MNSKQGTRYIKRRMGNDLKHKILIHNGIVQPEGIENKPSVNSCQRCGLVNPIENKYCSNCSYPLTPYAYEEIKQDEEIRFKKIEENYSNKSIVYFIANIFQIVFN